MIHCLYQCHRLWISTDLLFLSLSLSSSSLMIRRLFFIFDSLLPFPTVIDNVNDFYCLNLYCELSSGRLKCHLSIDDDDDGFF